MASFDRRTALRGGLTAIGASTLPLPAWGAGQGLHNAAKGFGTLSGEVIDLSIDRAHFTTGGRSGHAVAVNGTIPGPLIRLREGQDVTINVANRLDEDSSIHWHGMLVPFQFDGVPGVSFPGIGPRDSFTYRFPVRQAGTYWWHSHSGLQEQIGHYGPLIIDPAAADPHEYDREFVLILSEFTPHHPHTIMRNLKVGEHYYNRQMMTLNEGGMTLGDRLTWGRMRMNPRDISDVTGAEYAYLINGHGPADDLELLFQAGERVRLRIINGSAMTFFNIRIPGTEMTVVQADGQDVAPVAIDEFQIGVAETYDVIVSPKAGAHVIVAEAIDRSGMGIASLTSMAGHRTEPPALREPVTLTMADMGMMAEHADMDHSMRDKSAVPETVNVGAGVDMIAPMPMDRMDFPGLGLDKTGHRVLRYTDLKALRPNPVRPPERQMEIHLTGNMERYMWSFDGQKLNAVSDHPIRFAFDERVRVKLVNDTMMAHPIHLHGHFFELVNGADDAHQPLKHTLIVQPGGTATFDLTANEPGDWAFHCHLLYHMHSGMFQVVTVRPLDGAR
ncbi:multicopper oxidase domain-containing protein [Croceicoccus sp. Ery15]|uniref:multicopper oxidase domain-containing protein n=1 Tax=Croceicoccus sp. Ery15 TaxID=1703338 RepID=UPI00351D09D9